MRSRYFEKSVQVFFMVFMPSEKQKCSLLRLICISNSPNGLPSRRSNPGFTPFFAAFFSPFVHRCASCVRAKHCDESPSSRMCNERNQKKEIKKSALARHKSALPRCRRGRFNPRLLKPEPGAPIDSQRARAAQTEDNYRSSIPPEKLHDAISSHYAARWRPPALD